jgi:large subunit ribosomal protein L25
MKALASEKKMSSVFEFVAKSRDKSGKSAAKAVRRQGDVPAVIYGGNQAPEMLVLEHNEILKHLVHEAVYSHVLDITVDGKTQKAVLKGVQRHPAKPKVLHLDFMRVDEANKIKVRVPFHFINEATSVGVKKGGVAAHSMVDVEVTCLSSALPEFIAVDLANIDVGHSVHLSDLTLPAGVEIVELTHGSEHNLPVVSIMASKTKTDAE